MMFPCLPPRRRWRLLAVVWLWSPGAWRLGAWRPAAWESWWLLGPLAIGLARDHPPVRAGGAAEDANALACAAGPRERTALWSERPS